MDTDVLIVGAGPTGLMLANQLGRFGVRVQIIERNEGPSRQTRALGVQARTLEIYAHLGLVEQALALGKNTKAANIWVQGRRDARIPVGDMGREMSPYPFILILGQDDNERLLGDALQKQGIDIQWNTELVGLVQNSNQVKATLKHSDGTLHEVTAGWIAGCDGSRSTVRELNGIAFEGAPYEHVFFVADTTVTGSMVPDELNVYLWRQGFHLFFPMRGIDHWRIVGILPPNLRGRDDLTFEDVIPSVRHEAGVELNFKECSWYSTYRIQHRHAVRFRDRRCFLLGDAAHIHSPVGAQGMNTGLQDAYNLAWKLALVVNGRAQDSFLDSYQEERLPVAKRLLRSTDRAFSVIVSDSWLAGVFRTKFMAKAAALAIGFDSFRKSAFRTISQIGIQYRDSHLSETLAGLSEAAPRAGDRFPWLKLKFLPNGPVEDVFEKLDDTRFNLILFGQAAPSDGIPQLGGLLLVHEIPNDPENDNELKRLQIPRLSFFLMRPDCYIGLAGTLLDIAATARYITERLHFVLIK